MKGVYAIVDAGGAVAPKDAAQAARAMLRGGARILQLRAKAIADAEVLRLARELRAITREAGATFVVNDRADIAVLAGADGVHLGRDDLPAREVKRWLPAGMIVGVSCHSEAQLDEALADGAADYAGFGPVFPTSSKANPDPVVGLEGLAAACRRATLPLVAIGGIDHARLPEVRAAGAPMAAMISALTRSGDIEDAARRAVAAFAEGAR